MRNILNLSLCSHFVIEMNNSNTIIEKLIFYICDENNSRPDGKNKVLCLGPTLSGYQIYACVQQKSMLFLMFCKAYSKFRISILLKINLQWLNTSVTYSLITFLNVRLFHSLRYCISLKLKERPIIFTMQDIQHTDMCIWF